MGLTGIFSDGFIEHLFDLVELTRNVDDESLNSSVIKLIVRALASHQSFLEQCSTYGAVKSCFLFCHVLVHVSARCRLVHGG